MSAKRFGLPFDLQKIGSTWYICRNGGSEARMPATAGEVALWEALLRISPAPTVPDEPTEPASAGGAS